MRTIEAPATPWKSRAAGVVRHSLFTVARGVYAGRSAARRAWGRPRPEGPRVIVLDPDLIGPGGHHFEYARLLHAELGADNVRFYGHAAASLVVGTAFDARPIFRTSLYPPQTGATFAQTYRAMSDALERGLAAIDPDDLQNDTIAIVHTATIFALGGLAAWYAALPAARRPQLFVQFQHPLEFSFDPQRDRGEALRVARDAARTLMSAGIVRFAANTTGCAELTSRQLEAPCALVPCPIGWPERAAPAQPEPGIVFGFFGGLRAEKGASLLAPAIAAFTERHPDARFIVQAPPDSSNSAVVRALQALRGVELIRSALAGAEYHAALRRARWALLPYEPEPYRVRTSGIFIEAIGLGIPVVVTGGTWMADELRTHGAPGLVMRDHSVGALVACLDEARLAMEVAGTAALVPNIRVMRHYSAAAFCAAIRRLMIA